MSETEKKEEVKNEVVKTEETKIEGVATKDVKLEESKKEEPKKEEPKSKPKNEMNLAEIIIDYLGVEKKDIELTPKLLKMMKELPTIEKCHLENIEIFFTKIVEDKKIDMKDLPELIGLMQELFIIYDNLRMKADASDVGKVFKVLIQVLILYRLEDSDKLTQEQKDALLSTFGTVIGLCSQMIDLKDTQKTLKKWCVFIPCL